MYLINRFVNTILNIFYTLSLVCNISMYFKTIRVYFIFSLIMKKCVSCVLLMGLLIDFNDDSCHVVITFCHIQSVKICYMLVQFFYCIDIFIFCEKTIYVHKCSVYMVCFYILGCLFTCSTSPCHRGIKFNSFRFLADSLYSSATQ